MFCFFGHSSSPRILWGAPLGGNASYRPPGASYILQNLPIHEKKQNLETKISRKKIEKFRQDEIDHKDIAYDEGATKEGLYSIFDKVIKTGSKIAINISEKI